MERRSAPPEVAEIVEGDNDQKGQEEGMGRKGDNQEGGGAAEPPSRSSRVAAPPVSSQESAHVPEEGMPGACS